MYNTCLYFFLLTFFGLENLSDLPNWAATSLQEPEERARGCYAKAGFNFKTSFGTSTALWGKKKHSGSEWQRWKKVPTWSIWVSKRQVTMSDQHWK